MTKTALLCHQTTIQTKFTLKTIHFYVISMTKYQTKPSQIQVQILGNTGQNISFRINSSNKMNSLCLTHKFENTPVFKCFLYRKKVCTLANQNVLVWHERRKGSSILKSTFRRSFWKSLGITPNDFKTSN